MNTPPTLLTYLEQGTLLTGTARILALITLETGKHAVILDHTIFYPQGGGQPYDQGTIKSLDASALFLVEEVRLKDGIVYHIGDMAAGTFEVQSTVIVEVNKERRLLNSKNHTAGHIIDCALYALGMRLEPASGYHYPEGAYVEYKGTMEEHERLALTKTVQEMVSVIIKNAVPISIKMVSFEALKQLVSFVPTYISKDKPSRVMIVEGYPAIPCGGTHLQNTKDVGNLVIEKISTKKGNLRISYSVS